MALVAVAATAGRGFAAGTATQVLPPGQQAGISVSGEGKVTVVPDVAVVSLSVEGRAPTVEAARDQAARAMDAMLASLASNGVDKKDVQTRSLNINPEWRNKSPNEPPQIVGYMVNNQISVKIRQLGKVTTTLDGAIAAGGNAVRMQGIQFTIDNPDAALKQARDAAVADAKAKASQLARQAGVSLGRPSYIADQSAGGAPVPYLEKAAMGRSADLAMQTPVEPGTSELRVVVQITYTIE